MLFDPERLLPLNLLLRGATIALLLLIASALWPHPPAPRRGAARRGLRARHRRRDAGRAATLAGNADALRALVAALAAGAMFVFWLFTRALLDDAFALRRWHARRLGSARCARRRTACLIAPRQRALAVASALTLVDDAGTCALVAAAQSLAAWRADLVERRRRLRIGVVAATARLRAAGQRLVALAAGASLGGSGRQHR